MCFIFFQFSIDSFLIYRYNKFTGGKMTKKKKIIIESIVLTVLIVYLILSQLCCGLFFKNKFSNENISFYYNKIENYNLNSSDKKGLEEYFTELTEKIKTNPFYSEEKKLSFFICDNYGLYTFFSNINNKSMGITNTYGNHGFIVLNKTDLSKKETITQSKENNTRSFESLVLHESTHVFLTKIHNLLNRFSLPSWKEEGICETVAAESSYSIEAGLKDFFAGNSNSSKSYKYFLHRLTVLYMKNHEKLSYDDIIKDKRKQTEILEEIKQIPYDEAMSWF